jgi:5-formyltetrahydrofolate cyclo-ligase
VSRATGDLAAAKRDIRRHVLEARDGMAGEAITAGSQAVVQRLIGLGPISTASTVLAYLAFGSEVSVDGLLCWGWNAGKRMAVPLCRPADRGLIACCIEGFDEVGRGWYGIREPKGERLRTVPPGEIDAIVVPGVAFDRQGRRLGFGGGYYDRFLAAETRAVRIGVAFACQVVAEVPAGPHDIPMNCIVTDREIIIPR